MLNKLCRTLMIVGVTVGLMGAATVSEARWDHNNRGYEMSCRWEGGFWRHGNWIPRQKVCTRVRANCFWEPAHRNHYGRWVEARRICR